MKWLSAGLTFVNFTTICGVLIGIASQGLSYRVALASAILGLGAALMAYFGTRHSPAEQELTVAPAPGAASAPGPDPNSAPPSTKVGIGTQVARTLQRYRSIWFWLVVGVFASFAVRSFCNVLFIDGNELKIQSPNNLGDLSLHLTYINNFSSGVPLWPENPIYYSSKLRYPAGVDLFNALLVCLHLDLIRGLVWTGLLASVATCYALYRWGGTFVIAGFLFNGGLAGFKFFKTFTFLDYQGGNFIAWKSLALSMMVTQRGLLYALPVGLLLLCQWRAKYFPQVAANGQRKPSRPPLPFWVELSLYATMPLFHIHTFLALSLVLAFLFLFFLPNAQQRKQLAFLGSAALLPATFFVWLVTDHFHAGSVMQWNPGWVQNNGDFARPMAVFATPPVPPSAPVTGFFGTLNHFLQFWVINFGITIPLIILLLVVLAMRAWKQRNEPAPVKIYMIGFLSVLAVSLVAIACLFAYRSLGYSLFVVLGVVPPVVLAGVVLLSAVLLQRKKTDAAVADAVADPSTAVADGSAPDAIKGLDWKQSIPISAPAAFVIPAVALFVFSCLVKTAPWEWDNIKLIIWAYLLVLPFLWSELISRWMFPIRAVVCIALFFSGFVTLLGGIAAGKTGFGLANREELDGVGQAVRQLPADARYAAFPIYNHPLLLQGRRVILGYPGHVWTQGFHYGETNTKLGTLMQGAPDWKETARHFQTRYIFWGREEKQNYGQSKRPWEQESKLVASGNWGAIYDLESPRDATPVATPVPTGQ